MSTTRAQRIGIWVIAVVLTVGTIGSFFVMILANDNSKIDQANSQQQQEKYKKAIDEYKKKAEAQNAELSDKYYPVLSQYITEVGPFNADDVKTLQTKDLKDGDGDTVTKDTKFSAYYIGWNAEGKVFDGSIEGSKLKAPFPLGPDAGVIQGWKEGLIGMKLGGVRELTIPADKAYGDKGQGDLIPPHAPLKFIVLAIPTPPEIAFPDVTGAAQ